jgi:hypothetical protein
VFDAVVVGGEAACDTPENGLGAAGDVDPAVDGADVGLDGIGAEIGQSGDVGVVFALGDQRQDLRLSITEPFTSAGPIKPTAPRARCGASLITISPACTASSAATSSRAGNVFER